MRVDKRSTGASSVSYRHNFLVSIKLLLIIKLSDFQTAAKYLPVYL